MTNLDAITSRNARVEADKAWETSWCRRMLITLATYVIIGGSLSLLGVAQAWLHAVVPATGYLISTLGLKAIKTLWLSYIYKPQGTTS